MSLALEARSLEDDIGDGRDSSEGLEDGAASERLHPDLDQERSQSRNIHSRSGGELFRKTMLEVRIA